MASIAKLVAELNLDDAGLEKGLGRARGALGSFGKVMAVGFAATAVAAVGVGVALFKIGDAYDSMSDSIAIKTGASGDALKALQDDAIDVFKTIPTTMQIAGDAIAAISAKTGDTGKALTDLTASEIELARVTGTDLNSNIEESAKIFNAWGIAGKDQTKTLDGLFNASQKYGVGVDVLMGQVEQFTPVLKTMGLNADQGANLIGKIDKAGGHASLIFRGLQKETISLAKSGTPVKQGMTDAYNSIKNAGSAADATAIAVKDFGSKAGPELAQMIRDGTISVDDLTGAVDENGKSILDSAKGTYDFAENFTLFKNNIEAALIPLGTLVFQGLNLLIPLLTDGVKAIGTFASAMGDAFGTGTKVSDLVKQFPGWLQPLATALLLVADAAGDVVRGFQTGGLAGAFDALGPAIQQAVGALGSFAIDVVVDIGKWVLGKIPDFADWLDKLLGGGGGGGASGLPTTALPGQIGDGFGGGSAPHVTVGALAVDILGFAAGKVADLWGWIKGLFGVGGRSATGDGTGGPDTDKVITLSSVAVGIGSWIISKAADIGADIVRFLAATAVTLAGVAVSIGSWVISTAADIAPDIVRFLAATAVELKSFALTLGVPAISNAASDVGTWLQDWLDGHPDAQGVVKNWELVFNDPTQLTVPDPGAAASAHIANKSTIVEIQDWWLQLQGKPSMTPEQEAQANQSVSDLFKGIKWNVVLGKIELANPIGQLSVSFNNMLNESGPILIPALKMAADLGTADLSISGTFGAGPAGLAAWLGAKLGEKIGNISVPIPSWAIDLPTPTIGNALIGTAQLGLSIGPLIADKIGNINVPLPSWKLNVPTPSLGDFPAITDLVALANDGLVALGVLTNDWPNGFHLNVPTPDLGSFPSWNDIFNVVWGGLKGLGDLSVPWPNGFSLDIPLPSIGSFPSWNDIWNLIFGQLSGLGSFSFGLPFSINPFPGHANGGVVGHANGGVVGYSGGGRVVMVGERGPELAALPVGTRVFNHSETMSMLQGAGRGGQSVVFESGAIVVNPAPGMDERALADYMAAGIVRELQLRSA